MRRYIILESQLEDLEELSKTRMLTDHEKALRNELEDATKKRKATTGKRQTTGDIAVNIDLIGREEIIEVLRGLELNEINLAEMLRKCPGEIGRKSLKKRISIIKEIEKRINE